MEHLQEERLIEHLWDGAVLTATEQHHLSICSECQRQVATLSLLQDDFAVARASAVRPEAEERLFALFDAAMQHTATGQSAQGSSLFGRLVEWIEALPLWDSRQQALALGTRSAGQASYRLLYGANDAEVELMVEPKDGLLRVVGELILNADDSAQGSGDGLALVELMTSMEADKAVDVVSDADGHFAFEGVLPGSYVLTITPRASSSLILVPLELI